MDNQLNFNITYEELLQSMLSRVSDQHDKREGSPIFTSLAPTAVELQQVYIHLKYILNEFFIETASREFLVLRAAERGLAPHEATKAQWKGIFNIDVPIGARFSLDELNYVVLKQIAVGEFILECETTGEIGNLYAGSLIPIEYINGLQSAELAELVAEGQDEETTEHFRERFLEFIRLPATSGNKSHYKIWTKAVPGVGDALVFPVWNGPGTVKVAIIDTDKRTATVELIAAVASYIEEMRPIGATVTVVGAIEKAIDVSANITLANGYTISQVQSAFQMALIQHFADIAFSKSYVSYAQIGNLLLNIPGVGDYTNLLLNGTGTNVLLNDEEIPIVGTIVVGMGV